MPRITVQGGKLVVRDGKLGTGQGCCCDGCDCSSAGAPPAIASDADRGLVWLEFLSCIGDGAAATVDAPAAAGPCNYAALAGPISSVTLTSGGSGYARYGRVEPTVIASVPGGSGATLSVSLSQQTQFLGEGCLEAAYWSVAGVSVTNGGTGYADKTLVAFAAAAGDTVVSHAQAYAYVEVDSPQNAVASFFDSNGAPSSGAGAIVVPAWAVDTSGYTAIPRPGSRNPPFCYEPPRTAYAVTGFTITNGGAAYAAGDEIELSFATSIDGVTAFAGRFVVSSVDAAGAITAISVTDGGVYGGSMTDVLSEVVVEACTDDSGVYYREDPDEPPIVADVTVVVHQEAPSTGSGAEITATVETDTSSADFGKVVSLAITSAGTGYLEVPLACQLPDKMYITWGDATAEVPLRLADNFGEFSAFPCSSPLVCRGGEDDTHLEDAGNTGSIAVGTIMAPGVECKCDGKLHVTVRLDFFCYECIATVVGFGGFQRNTVGTRVNKERRRTACLRFDVDESGCPVGDAEVVSWQTGEQSVTFQCAAPTPFCQGCSPWTNHDGTYFPSDPCPCDSTCDVEIVPTVSLMP